MSTNNLCFFYKAVVKSGCNVKTTKLLDCALIGACVIIRSITVFVQHLNPGWTFGTIIIPPAVFYYLSVHGCGFRVLCSVCGLVAARCGALIVLCPFRCHIDLLSGSCLTL